MSRVSLSRRLLLNNTVFRSQRRSFAEKSAQESSNPDHNDPTNGPAYKAEGRRHRTDNETQREQAVRGTPEEVCSWF